jgi:hypothetical protein
MNFFFHPVTKHSYADQTGDALFAPNPMVQLYNPYTYLPEYFDADIKERDVYDDKGPIFGVFWPDAMTQAMRKLMDRYGLQGYNRTTKQLDEGPEEYGPRIDMAPRTIDLYTNDVYLCTPREPHSHRPSNEGRSCLPHHFHILQYDDECSDDSYSECMGSHRQFHNGRCMEEWAYFYTFRAL